MKFKTGDNIRITNVGVEHLKKYENFTGTIISWICRRSNDYRYKVMFEDKTTAYFKKNEMEGVM